MRIKSTSWLQAVGAVVLVAALQGCGFKMCNPCLFDDDAEPLASVTYFPHMPEQGLAQALRDTLYERRIGLNSGNVLELSEVVERITLLSSNVNGTPLEYQLSVSGSYRSYTKGNDAPPEWETFTAQRSYLFNGENLLANQYEEQILREDIYQRMINVILRHAALQAATAQ